MKTFKEYVTEKTTDLGDLQVAWNKYRFETENGSESNAKSWKKKVDTISKRVLKQDPNAVNSAGLPWSKVLSDK